MTTLTADAPHPSTRIRFGRIGTVDIDDGIVPAVLWINSIPGVRSLFCCQGGHGHANRPYILFAADAMEGVRSVVATLWACRLATYGEVSFYVGEEPYGTISIDEFEGSPRFMLEWPDPDGLRAFQDYLAAKESRK